MTLTTAPLMAVLATAMLLTACASDDGGWMGGRHHDRDRDHHDNHLMSQQTQPAGPPAPVVASR